MVLDDFKEISLSTLYSMDDGTDEEWNEGSPEQKVSILEKMIPKTKVIIPILLSNPRALKIFEREIKELQDAGLNLGKGDNEYGYKMPLPESNKSSHRELIIYKRR